MRRVSFFQLSLLIFFLTLTGFRYVRQRPVLPEQEQLVTIEGTVAGVPYIRGESQYARLREIEIISSSDPLRLNKVYLRARIFPELSYADRIRAVGALSPYGSMKFPEVTMISSGGRGLRSFFFKIRKEIEDKFEAVLPQDEAGLLSGILLGSEGALSASLENSYRRAGLTHVVVASGYNMSVLLEFFMVVTSPFGLAFSVISSLLGLAAYASLLGWQPPVARAFLMSFIGVFGFLVGRKKAVLRVLMATAVLMVFVNPVILSSLSFQLSFAATFGLVAVGNNLERLLNKFFGLAKNVLLKSEDRAKEDLLKDPRFYIVSFFSYLSKVLQLGENFSSAAAAALFIYPISSFHFGQFSLVSFFANTFLLWTTPPAMFLGLVSTAVLPFSKALFKLIVWCSWPFLRVFNVGARVFSRAPFRVEHKMTAGEVAVYFLALFALCTVFLKSWGTVKNEKD